jgi:hypothetical protein
MKTGTYSGGIKIRLLSSVSPDATYRQSAKSGNCFHFCYSDNLLLLSLLHSFRFENLYSELLTSISRDSRFIHAQVYSSTLWIYWFLNSLSPGQLLNYSAILNRSVFIDTLQRNFIDTRAIFDDQAKDSQVPFVWDHSLHLTIWTLNPFFFFRHLWIYRIFNPESDQK